MMSHLNVLNEQCKARSHSNKNDVSSVLQTPSPPIRAGLATLFCLEATLNLHNVTDFPFNDGFAGFFYVTSVIAHQRSWTQKKYVFRVRDIGRGYARATDEVPACGW